MLDNLKLPFMGKSGIDLIKFKVEGLIQLNIQTNRNMHDLPYNLCLGFAK